MGNAEYMGSVLKTLNGINMKFFAFLASVALVSAKNLKLDELEVGFCDGANQDVLSLDNISVEPFPLVIATGADSLTVTLPEIPGILVDLLASGTYYADATVNYADGSEMTCIYLRVEITGH